MVCQYLRQSHQTPNYAQTYLHLELYVTWSSLRGKLVNREPPKYSINFTKAQDQQMLPEIELQISTIYVQYHIPYPFMINSSNFDLKLLNEREILIEGGLLLHSLAPKLFYRSDAIQKYIFNGLKNVTPNCLANFLSVYSKSLDTGCGGGHCPSSNSPGLNTKLLYPVTVYHFSIDYEGI